MDDQSLGLSDQKNKKLTGFIFKNGELTMVNIIDPERYIMLPTCHNNNTPRKKEKFFSWLSNRFK